MIAKLREYLLRKGGEATSEQVLDKFDDEIKGKVSIQLIRSMLKEIADFKKRAGYGFWVLKPEFS